MNTSLTSQTVKSWIPWLGLLLCCAILQLIHAYPVLRLEIGPPQWSWLYTLFTSHLVHLNTRHWLHNSLALLVIAGLFTRQYHWRTWLQTMLFSAVCISLGLLLFADHLHSYAGLSGLLHGLFAMGCLLLYRERPALAVGMGLLVLLKLLVEQLLGPLWQSADITVASAAHGYGVMGGALSGLTDYAIRTKQHHQTE